MAGQLTSLEEARKRVLAHVRPLSPEEVPIDDAPGRVLAADVLAPHALPPFDSSAMDGFALRAPDTAEAGPAAPVSLRIAGESRAGAPFPGEVAPGEAITISTGALMPAGADAVVRVEDTAVQDGRLLLRAPVAEGAEIRRAGEDLAAGARALAAGTLVGPAEVGMLAAVGLAFASCARRPRLSLLVTGDELRGPGGELPAGGIRDSSSHAVAAMARQEGAEVTRGPVVPDEEQRTRAAIAQAAALLPRPDVLVICGGMSVGPHDHVRPALAQLGAREELFGLALRPGKPAWFGTLGGMLVFGLPGNPVSAMVTFRLLVAPALRAMQGSDPAARRAVAVADFDHRKQPGRAHALRVSLQAREDGWHALPTGAQGSHIVGSMLGADALAIVPAESAGFAAGERVELELL